MPASIPVDQIIRFHSRLNPRLWSDDQLQTGVRLTLLRATIAFYRFLDLPRLRVADVILTGSNAGYNYTPLSDIDVHLLVDFAKTSCPILADNFFMTKKTLWNQTYDITVRNQPTEFYVENIAEPVRANGIYSILRGKWIKQPSRDPPPRHDTAVRSKAEALADEIDTLLSGDPSINDINALLSRLYILRQNGLCAAGEFSTENTAFKVLRAAGYLERLYDARVSVRDRNLSL